MLSYKGAVLGKVQGTAVDTNQNQHGRNKGKRPVNEVQEGFELYKNGHDFRPSNFKQGHRFGGNNPQIGRGASMETQKDYRKRFAVSAEGLIGLKQSEVSHLSDHEKKMLSAYLGKDEEQNVFEIREDVTVLDQNL